MPFDAAVAKPVSTLRSRGLVPVDAAVVDRHKATVVHAYALECYDHDYRVRNRMALWETVYLKGYCRKGSWLSRWLGLTERANRTSLTQLLERPPLATTNDRSGAPRPIIDVAQQVRRVLPQAQFVIEYFYTDPILWVYYRDRTGSHNECLGIWDHGEVIAIAQ